MTQTTTENDFENMTKAQLVQALHDTQKKLIVANTSSTRTVFRCESHKASNNFHVAYNKIFDDAEKIKNEYATLFNRSEKEQVSKNSDKLRDVLVFDDKLKDILFIRLRKARE